MDWKTEWVQAEKLEQQTREHLPQLAIYFRAIKDSLGCVPQVSVCYLYPRYYRYAFSEEQL